MSVGGRSPRGSDSSGGERNRPQRDRGWSVTIYAALALAVAVGSARLPKGEESRAKEQTADPFVASMDPNLKTGDLYQLKSVGDVQLSPDATHVAYNVQNNDRPGRPYSQVWIKDISTGASNRVGSDKGGASSPLWSPDGNRIAYFGREAEERGIFVSNADGSHPTFLAPVEGTNHPLPSSGERLAWSPDGRQLAFVSATPGPETENANGDPMVITRYLYKPTASEGLTRFNDNLRLHIFVVDVESKQQRQLTSGNYYEHSIDWSPRGDEIVFISNHEPDPDRVFNYDIFAVRVSDGTIRQITRTKKAEYRPAWSPDGHSIAYLSTKRPLTSSETTMEDTHVWLIDADGGNQRELGGAIDNRQGLPQWTPDGLAVCYTVQERGSTRLYRQPVAGGQPQAIVPPAGERGTVSSWSIAPGSVVAYALTTTASPAELYVSAEAGVVRKLTEFNKDLLSHKTVADVDSLTFKARDGLEVEAFLTKPLGLTATSKHPMIVMIKGGPHSQQGPAWNHQAQVYAGQGWAVLMVNYRGSTGYGQKFTDAIFNDQNGAEALDVLAGVDAALSGYAWIDPARLGVEGRSYGGQLTNWIVTRTHRFKAAIPTASIANLVSFNYMSYYHDYLAVEFGVFPHEMWRRSARTPPRRLMDFLWERSPLRYVASVKTPTMFVHGEHDNDVPIAEAEQFYIALKDAGVETIMVRYPREGHGIRETKHVVDMIDRSIAWYERHFSETPATVGN